MKQIPVQWTSLPQHAWNVLEHLEMSLLEEDTCFILEEKRWYSTPVNNPEDEVSNQSYAISTMKPLIEVGILEEKFNNQSSFLYLTELGRLTIKCPPPNEMRGLPIEG